MLLLSLLLISAPKMDLPALQKELTQKHGDEARVKRGLAQVASLWRGSDGDLATFAREHFVSGPELETTFTRLQSALEQIDGHNLEISRELQRGTQLDIGPMMPLDPLLAGYDPMSHFNDDAFKTKLAFVTLLNFPLTTLQERLVDGEKYTRRQWAETRLAGRFARRIPAEVQQKNADVGAKASLYIDEYNVWMHHVLDASGARLFPKDKKLISHWNLRDELKSAYADKAHGLAKQRAITKVMERIVTQTIPLAVINNPRVDWDPAKNTVTATPAAELDPASDAARSPAA